MPIPNLPSSTFETLTPTSNPVNTTASVESCSGYRASAEHWRLIENWPGLSSEYPGSCVILELRARIEALESAQQPAPATEESSATAPNAAIFPMMYADSDGDGIRILMEPADETGRVCWVVRNSRHVNPCHEFSSPEDAYAAHRRAQLAAGPQQPADHIPDATKMVAPPAPAGKLVERLSRLLAKRFSESRPGIDCTPFACDVLREVASWLRSHGPGWPFAAVLLEREANR